MTLIPPNLQLLFWLIINVCFALGPMIISYLIRAVDKQINVEKLDVIKDGELFFFATAISAGTLYYAMDKMSYVGINMENMMSRESLVPRLMLIAIIALVVIVISSAFGGILTYSKLKESNTDSNGGLLDKESYNNVAKISILMAVIAAGANLALNLFLQSYGV